MPRLCSWPYKPCKVTEIVSISQMLRLMPKEVKELEGSPICSGQSDRTGVQD